MDAIHAFLLATPPAAQASPGDLQGAWASTQPNTFNLRTVNKQTLQNPHEWIEWIRQNDEQLESSFRSQEY